MSEMKKEKMHVNNKFLENYIGFQIVYDIKKKSNSFNRISKQLSNLSNIKLKEWELDIEEGRMEIFQLFDNFEPHFSLKNKRFEIFVSNHSIKINFPEEPFFHIKGPKRYFRITGFPSEEAEKPVSNEELDEINDLLNIILLSKMGISISEDLDNINVFFNLKTEGSINFTRLEKHLSSENRKYNIDSFDFSWEENENKYLIEIISGKNVRGRCIFKDMKYTDSLKNILYKTSEKVNDGLKGLEKNVE